MKTTSFPTFAAVLSMIGAALVLASSPAGAEDRGPHTIKSGEARILLSYASYSPETCYFVALPRMKIIQAPAHGTARVGKFAHEVDSGACSGTKMRSTAIEYRSTAGYRGPDAVVVEVETDLYTNGIGTRGERIRIDVNVK